MVGHWIEERKIYNDGFKDGDDDDDDDDDDNDVMIIKSSIIQNI